MKFYASSIGFAAALIASSATAQPAVVEQPAATLMPAPMNKLTQGSEVSLRLLRELTTKDKALKVGDRFDLELVDSLKLGAVTVIPSGTRAVGEIMSVRNKGMWGKSGQFNARLMYLRIGDRNVKLGGTFDDKGVAGGWGAAAASAIVFLPAGFFMTGTSAKVEAGTIVKGFLDEDVPVSINESVANQPIVASGSGSEASDTKNPSQ
jgi:hypothetical protein